MNFHYLAGSRFWHLYKLLRQHRIDWNGKSLFRVSSSISWTLIMSPFNVLEHLLYGQQIERQALEAPIFIIGHPRSGTTFLHYLLCKDAQFGYCNIAQCFAPHSFRLTKGLTSFFFKAMLPKKRQMDNLEMSYDRPFEEEFAVGNLTEVSMVCGYYFPESLYRYFEKAVLLESRNDASEWLRQWHWFLKKVAWLTKKQQLVIKSPYNLARTEEILELFPNAKFIHIYREPQEVYASSIHLLRKSLPELALQKWDDKMIKEFVFRSYRAVMEKYASNRANIPEGQLLELHFDELVGDTGVVLAKIYERFSLLLTEETNKAYEQELSKYSDYQRNTFDISEGDKARIEKEWSGVGQLFENRT